jgi:hypothetical protein
VSSTFQFKTPPGAIGAAMKRRIDQIPAALLDLGTSYASRMEEYARANAPWNDRTTNARAGLTGEAVSEGGSVRVYLYHTADPYGPYLELGTAPRDNGHPGMAPRPIILPTIQAHQTELMESAARLVLGLLSGGGAR